MTRMQNAPIYLLPDAARTPLRVAAPGTILQIEYQDEEARKHSRGGN